MNRSNWKFSYSTEKLAEAALQKKAMHENRLMWWQQRSAKIEEEVQKIGVRIEKSAASIFSNSGNPTAQISIDEKYQSQIDEAQSRINFHINKIKEYDGWIQVFSAENTPKRLELDNDDWLFFFGMDKIDEDKGE